MKGNQYTLIISRSLSKNNNIYIQQQWYVGLPKLFTKNTRKKIVSLYHIDIVWTKFH